MSYVFVSTQIRLESGPCRVGDESSDPDLMAHLEAELVKERGVNFSYWQTELKPRQVLDRLAAKGYRLVSSTGVGQTFVATLFKSDT